MQIQKIGHSCLVLEENGVRIMTDPGRFTSGQTEVSNLDAICITHAHADHLDTDTIAQVVANNPDATILCNGDTGTKLDGLGINWQQLADGDEADVGGVVISGVGTQHHHIHEEIPAPENTGFLIGDLFHPGDAYSSPPQSVRVLAAPMSAPWGTIGEDIDYLRAVAPEYAFPIHDGLLKQGGPFYYWAERLVPAGTTFTPLENGGVMTV